LSIPQTAPKLIVRTQVFLFQRGQRGIVDDGKKTNR